MLKPQLQQTAQFSQTLFLLHNPFLQRNGTTNSLATRSRISLTKTQKRARVGFVPSNNIKAVASPSTAESSNSVKAVVTVQLTVAANSSEKDLIGKRLLLELVSADLDRTGQEKETIKGDAKRRGYDTYRKDSIIFVNVKYEAEFGVPHDFGLVGAVRVENEHCRETYLKDINLYFPNGAIINITCNSWVHSKFDNNVNRVFFTNKSYLPNDTPSGLTRLRREELEILRGNCQGMRKPFERIYDYDVYNDLGDPDTSPELKRPVLGGNERPYPRRCRTGRNQCDRDSDSEKRGPTVYVPRDEAFSEIKGRTFPADTVNSMIHRLQTEADTDPGFRDFTAIDSLYNIEEAKIPETIKKDKFFWLSDEEFGRQTIAGLNPFSLQLVKEWPLKSKLDPSEYGPPESKITTELIEKEIKGFMTVTEAIEQKKLFILDYHDLFLPYVAKVCNVKNTTLYGSRTVFFLTPDGQLRPLAIELTQPPMDGKTQWKEVYAPSWHSTGVWLWRLAKAHVLAHDSAYHQLVSHWLRTHCCTEPYIIATNRQLSVMHPIYRLLHPHFRYTMEINALSRQFLISAAGIIEISFSPVKYSMELCSDAYKQWQFDLQALPADLVSRGMAVEDPNEPRGLKLTIEDYPFANDGLDLWDSLKEWVSEYVKHYYPDPSLIESDVEIQTWWKEIQTDGHADKKGKEWWPVLETPQDLIDIITIIVWVTSGHHAAVNFGQYAYAGYFPNRPTIARTNMPIENPSDELWEMLMWDMFMDKPEGSLLQCFPSQIQATTVMAVLDVLSNHSPDEEYLGKTMEPSWAEDPVVKAAFERFSGRLKALEVIVDERNANKDLKNRHGAGIVPYELLKPFSEAGVTGKGVPYSISI